jgi:hypothetical protein
VETIKRIPKGEEIWPKVINDLCCLASNESQAYLAPQLLAIAKDLTERDLRDVEVHGRRIATDDVLTPRHAVYFHMLDTLGYLQAVPDCWHLKLELMMLTAKMREEFYG